MLRIQEAVSRTFNDRLADVYTDLPTLTREWTNYNPSDPGITILENLTLFETLQGFRANALSARAERMLLKMAGFEPKRGKCARLLLSAEGLRHPALLPNGQRFILGDLVFETRKQILVGDCHLTGIYSRVGDEYHNLSFLLDREYRVPGKAFGDKPKEGDAIYFIADALPEAGKDTSFYIEIDAVNNRNSVENRGENIFAALKWECYTSAGFEEMKVKDYTGAFLYSGEIKLKMPDTEAVLFTEGPEKGYCIRATLTRASYDIRPRLYQVDAFLFEVWQKNTRSICHTYQKNRTIRITSPIENEGYILVFGKEEKGSSYRRYELAVTTGQEGRYCLYERGENGNFSLTFDRDIFGFEPERHKDAVRVVIYSEEIMRRYRVGEVLGYDDQELELPVSRIVPESFCLIAKRLDENGVPFYDFVRPEKDGEDALFYHLLENDGKIVIEDAGAFIGAELFMGGCAVTEGPKGNIRALNHLRAPGFEDSADFINPAEGTGGVFRETLKETRERFREDVYTPYTCVTEEDYERLTASTPGLCIRKTRANMNEMENIVHIAVLPGTDEEFPKLSEAYRKAIEERLDERRLINTRFQILSPVYVGVSVRATVYIKRHYSDCREKIEERFRSMIRYADSEKNFGEVLQFEEVFRAVEELDCVEFIYELAMRPENGKYATLKNSNIHPAENALLYPGNIDLELITYEK
ncbi:MAG: baseplate J/gp47 family protein [Lachnospiraceae bacterium]|nr:baseplate J/gp47 family protein [Lachnospiraceae bacterium]